MSTESEVVLRKDRNLRKHVENGMKKPRKSPGTLTLSIYTDGQIRSIVLFLLHVLNLQFFAINSRVFFHPIFTVRNSSCGKVMF